MSFFDGIKRFFGLGPKDTPPSDDSPASSSALTGEQAAAPPKIARQKEIEARRATIDALVESMDRDAEKQWIGAESQRIATALNGRFVERRDPMMGDIDFEVQDASLDRPMRLQIDGSNGTLSLEAKLDNKLGMLVIQRDPFNERPPPADPNDPFAEPDARIYFTDHIFVENMGVGMHDVVNSLDPHIKEALWTFMNQYNLHVIAITPTELLFSTAVSLFDLDQPVDAAQNFFKMGVNLCDLFESAEQGVGWTPGVYYQDGERIETDQDTSVLVNGVPLSNFAPTVNCAYCGSVVIINEHSSCPNCGAPLSV